MEEVGVLKKCFDAWRAARFGSIAKQQLVRRAAARIQRGLLSRAFLTWKDRLPLVANDKRMRAKLMTTLDNGRLRRCLRAWKALAEERWWKDQYAVRDRQIKSQEDKIRGFEKRPIVVLRKRKQSAILNAWYVQAEGRRARRQRAQRGLRFLANLTLGKAWNSWYEFHETCQRRKMLYNKTIGRLRNLRAGQAWNAWWVLVEAGREKRAKLARALGHFRNAAMAKAWASFVEYVETRREYKRIAKRWMNPMKAKALAGARACGRAGYESLRSARRCGVALLYCCSSTARHRTVTRCSVCCLSSLCCCQSSYTVNEFIT